jgi:hypothetical protein
LFFDESQQRTPPHVMHVRRCTHVSPIFRQSSQPAAAVVISGCTLAACFANRAFLGQRDGARHGNLLRRLLAAGFLYVNIHMANLPEGEIRRQLIAGAPASANVGGVPTAET